MGLPRHDFLYDIARWEARRLILGYRHRQYEAWRMVRWQTFWLMHNGIVDMHKAGLGKATDLLRLPWDTEADPEGERLSAEDVARIRRQLQEKNARLRKK